MRNVLIAAALAASGLLASGPALAAQQGAPAYQPGGPDQVGGWCKVVTDHDIGIDAYGYYTPCAGQSMAYAPRWDRRR